MSPSPHVDVVRGQVRSSAYRRLSHGLYLAGADSLPPRGTTAPHRSLLGRRPLGVAVRVSLAAFHELAGVSVTAQHEVVDGHGRVVARGDLRVDGTHVLHEYDGEGHAARQQRVADLRRERRLSEAGFVRHGFTAEHILVHPLVTLQELDRLLGRRHHPSRLARWRRDVALSSYSAVGRQRLLNRWLAYPGAHDCAKAAG